MRTIGNTPVDGEVRAVASGALANGDTVIVNADGTVSVVSATNVSASLGTSVQANSASVIYTDTAYDATSQKIVMVYNDNGNSNYGTAVVGTVSGTSISFGTPVVYESSNSNYNAIVYDPDSQKVVVAYSGTGSSLGYAIVGTVSGTSISFGTRAQFETGIMGYTALAYDTTSDKVVIAYRDSANSSHGTAVVGTVSGTSISFGSPVVFNAATTLFTSAAYDPVADRVVITYRDSGNSVYGTAILGTVSGNSISFGSEFVFASSATNNTSVNYDPSSGNVLITYTDIGNTSVGTAIVGSVSGDSISFGTAVVFNNSSTGFSPSVHMANTENMIVVINALGTGNGQLKTATITGTSVSFGSSTTFESGGVNWMGAAYNSDGNNLVIGYADYNGVTRNAMTGIVYQNAYIETNLTSENYIGIAKGAAANGTSAVVQTGCSINDAQSGLTAGQDYYVQTDGTLGLTAADPSVLAGTAVSATEIIVKG